MAEEQAGWQPLRTHLVNVAEKARIFAEPFGPGDEAYRAGLLHDLGKYGQAFQYRLRGFGSGINHWTAGAYEAYRAKAQAAAFAIDGHHKGVPAMAELQNRLMAHRQAGDLTQFGITETVATLVEQASRDGMVLPTDGSSERFSKCFTSGLYTRFLFSSLVDADSLDTESHFNPAAATRPALALRPQESLKALLDAVGAKPARGEVNSRRRQLLHECLCK